MMTTIMVMIVIDIVIYDSDNDDDDDEDGDAEGVAMRMIPQKALLEPKIPTTNASCKKHYVFH